jgi:hypothetical protein
MLVSLGSPSALIACLKAHVSGNFGSPFSSLRTQYNRRCQGTLTETRRLFNAARDAFARRDSDLQALISWTESRKLERDETLRQNPGPVGGAHACPFKHHGMDPHELLLALLS